MPLALRPHSVVVTPITQAVDASNVAQNPHASGSPVTVLGQFRALTANEALKEFGVEVTGAARFMCNLADAAVFAPDSEVTFGGQVYVCKGNPLLRDQGDPADHAVVLLELKQYGAYP